jgi:hypothetical protein
MAQSPTRDRRGVVQIQRRGMIMVEVVGEDEGRERRGFAQVGGGQFLFGAGCGLLPRPR